MGGRAPCRSATPTRSGHIFDHFAIDYEYPNGVHVLSMCRQINGCANSVSEALVGTKGVCQANASSINGKRVVQRGKDATTDPYVQEHTDLIASDPQGQADQRAEERGREHADGHHGADVGYTGKAITWEMALNSTENTMPENLSWDMTLATPPVAVPGKTKFV